MPTRREPVSADRLLSDLAERACAETRGAMRPELLAGYLPALLRAAAQGRRVAAADLRRCRELGAQAARDGVALPAIVDAYLSATRFAWADLATLLPAFGARSVPDRALSAAGQTVLRAADDALAAVAAGYVAAGRSLIRAEEARRREAAPDDVRSGLTRSSQIVYRWRRCSPLMKWSLKQHAMTSASRLDPGLIRTTNPAPA